MVIWYYKGERVVQKVFQLQINFFKYLNYYKLSITLDKLYKILLAKVIEKQNTVRTHCESINELINQHSFNK